MRKLTYDEVRDTIETGDLLFCRGNYFLSESIRRMTDSDVNHVAMFMWLNGRLMVIEASEDYGFVVIHPFSDYLESFAGEDEGYDGKLFVGKLKIAQTNKLKYASVRSDMLDYCISKLGRKYDKQDIVAIGMNEALNAGIKADENNLFICSELIGRSILRTGISVSTKLGFFYPEHILQSCDLLYEVTK